MPRLTSSCCDITSTCQSSLTSANTDVSVDTQRDSVTAVTHDPQLNTVSGISQQSADRDKLRQMCEKARHYGEKPGRPGVPGVDCTDYMLPPESTV